jgi:hypothetical protein
MSAILRGGFFLQKIVGCGDVGFDEAEARVLEMVALLDEGCIGACSLGHGGISRQLCF